MDRIKNKKELPHSDISENIIGCCFEVMKELKAGFLENVYKYKNALFIPFFITRFGENDIKCSSCSS